MIKSFVFNERFHNVWYNLNTMANEDNKEKMIQIAEKFGFGEIEFKTRRALNTGGIFQVGYVYVDGHKELFCKNQRSQGEWYLCNQFRELSV